MKTGLTIMLLSLVGLELTLYVQIIWGQSSDPLMPVITTLSRQLMLQQLYIEEMTRSGGDSGLKLTRLASQGPKSYQANSHTNTRRIASIHNHANNVRTVGMGEIIAVLNGVEFRTRHNDYRLNMPSRNESTYHKTEPIPFPQVPPEVMQYPEVNDQVREMREWFKAFKQQNTSHRAYSPYFKPVLCYLEGGWTTNTDSLDESFESDRHFIDADSWFDLQEKIMFTSYSGTKDTNENFAYLPTKIIGIKDGLPVLAQWNYRIMCHPLRRDLPLSRIQVVDDLASRMRGNNNMDTYEKSKTARFQINSKDSDKWNERESWYQLLDDLMGEVPGKDNYIANIQYQSGNNEALALNTSNSNKQPLNLGYYHRTSQISGKDAMGINKRRRGFNDRNIFMAATTNPKIAPMKMRACTGRGRKRTCADIEERWTYAIPIEIIYLTPLSSWNPYNLQYKGDARSTDGKTVTANGRNGARNSTKAYDGMNSKIFYQTPTELFDGDEDKDDPADTTKSGVGVLDPQGTVQSVSASGIRIHLPHIPDVGVIRQRYPIMPLHYEGNSIWKELEALKDIVLNPLNYPRVFQPSWGTTDVNVDSTITGGGIRLRLGVSSARQVGEHDHIVDVFQEEVEELYRGEVIQKTTSTNNNHAHHLEIRFRKRQGHLVFEAISCDDRRRCRDLHPRQMIFDQFLTN